MKSNILHEVAPGYFKIKGVDGGIFKNINKMWQFNLNGEIICISDTMDGLIKKIMEAAR